MSMSLHINRASACCVAARWSWNRCRAKHLEMEACNNEMQHDVIFALGMPGAGKTTQCRKIAKEFGFRHIAVGELVRDKMKEDFDEKEDWQGFIDKGQLLPSKYIVSLIKQSMMEDNPSTNFIIDAFPGNPENLRTWNSEMADKMPLKFALFFDCEEKTAEARIMSRAQAGKRPDDCAEKIRLRHSTYRTESQPVVDELVKLSKVRKIDAEKSAHEVFKAVTAVFQDAGYSRSGPL
ncbi:UMP-CMP kinase-like [Diadema setosum]|uniref:UMP-CMP kinase-like n=1 Tax=Diadema setosum TaxID=31175 RepID=UPI003B3B28DD